MNAEPLLPGIVWGTPVVAGAVWFAVSRILQRPRFNRVGLAMAEPAPQPEAGVAFDQNYVRVLLCLTRSLAKFICFFSAVVVLLISALILYLSTHDF